MSASTTLVDEAAHGAAAARAVIDDVLSNGRDPAIAWLKFIEVTVTHGRNSAACRAFVTELARAAR